MHVEKGLLLVVLFYLFTLVWKIVIESGEKNEDKKIHSKQYLPS